MDGENNEVRIGDWIICGQSYANEPDKIAIYRAGELGGEGGDFDRAEFIAHLAKFYEDRF